MAANVELPMAIARVSGVERRHRRTEMMEALNMEGKAERLPHDLS